MYVCLCLCLQDKYGPKGDYYHGEEEDYYKSEHKVGGACSNSPGAADVPSRPVGARSLGPLPILSRHSNMHHLLHPSLCIPPPGGPLAPCSCQHALPVGVRPVDVGTATAVGGVCWTNPPHLAPAASLTAPTAGQVLRQGPQEQAQQEEQAPQAQGLRPLRNVSAGRSLLTARPLQWP